MSKTKACPPASTAISNHSIKVGSSTLLLTPYMAENKPFCNAVIKFHEQHQTLKMMAIDKINL